MEIPASIAIGILATVSLFLLLQRSVIKVVFGLFLMSHVANLTIFTVGRLKKGAVPVIEEGVKVQSFADPLVQALVLTAIVIGFGLAAFLLILTFQTHREVGSDDLDELRNLRG